MSRTLSTFKIAQLLQVNPSSVANWVDQGLLQAHRTPGGHRRVASEDLIEFLWQHNMPVPKELRTSHHQVLVVDDEQALSTMIVRTLQAANEDLTVFEAHDGFRAGQIVATHRPDVVILDLRMPGMDGFEVCRLIKDQPETRGTVVLAMTAYGVPEVEQQIRQCGADEFFTKPLDMDKLIQTVREALTRRQ